LIAKSLKEVPTYGDFNFIKSFLSTNEDKFDLSVSHGRYDKYALRRLLGENVTLVTILREPISQFLSYWSYFKFSEERFNCSLDLWLQE